MALFTSDTGHEMARRGWALKYAGRPYPPAAFPSYIYDLTPSPSSLRGLAHELARVAAHEGEPARENYRRRAWLYPHLRPALPVECKETAA